MARVARTSDLLIAAAVALLAVAALLALAAPAGAKPIYSYAVQVRDASINGSPGGEVDVSRLDITQNSTIRVTHLGVETYRANSGIGASVTGFSAGTIGPGDVVEVYQPQIPAGPPGVAPDETFTVPAATFAATPGSNVVTGTVPASTVAATLRPDFLCYGSQDDEYTLALSGGNFSIALPKAVEAGVRMQLTVYPGEGDRVDFVSRTAGETPCLSVHAAAAPQPPGVPPQPSPYIISISNLNPLAAADIRIVASHDGANYLDTTAVASTSAGKSFGVQPLPGDRIDIYRPAAAGSPSASFTLPRVSAVYDPSNDLVAIDGEALLGTFVNVQPTFVASGIYRSIGPTPAGRRLIDVRQPSAYDDGVDLQPGDFVRAEGVDLSNRVYFEFPAVQGDLAPPNVLASVAKAFRLGRLKSKIKLALHANESATASIAVMLPKKLPTKRHPAPFKLGSTQRIAKGTARVQPGKSTVSLKFSKAGRRALAKLRAVGPRLKAVPLIISITSKDAAGNAVTTLQQGKVSR